MWGGGHEREWELDSHLFQLWTVWLWISHSNYQRQIRQLSDARGGMATSLKVPSLYALRTMAPLTYSDTLSSNPHSPEGINVLFKFEKTILPYHRVFSSFQKCPTIPVEQRRPFLWMLFIDSLGNLANIMKPISGKMHTYSTVVCKSRAPVKGPVGGADLPPVYCAMTISTLNRCSRCQIEVQD